MVKNKKNYYKMTEIIVASISAIAAIAAAFSAISLLNIEQIRMEYEEKSLAIKAISDWTKGHSISGGHCTALLNTYSKQEFIESAKSKKFTLRKDQVPFAERCFVGFRKFFQVGEDVKKRLTDNVIDNEERIYIAHQVSKQLSNYEILAMHWVLLGDDSKSLICEHVKVEQDSSLRLFRKTAKGTLWWDYTKFGIFLDECI